MFTLLSSAVMSATAGLGKKGLRNIFSMFIFLRVSERTWHELTIWQNKASNQDSIAISLPSFEQLYPAPYPYSSRDTLCVRRKYVILLKLQFN